MKCFLKWSVFIPILLGVVIGSLLFAVGALDDAPGMCAIGLSIGFLLVMLGIHCTGIIKKGLLAPILLLCFGIFMALLTTAIWLDREFENQPWLPLIGYAVAAAFLLVGVQRLRVLRKSDYAP